jgi:hypothetical protein
LHSTFYDRFIDLVFANIQSKSIHATFEAVIF